MSQPLVLLDVNETLSDMGGMSHHFEAVGAPPHLAALWFASVLRDGFALAVAGRNPPFREVAEGALRALLANQSLTRDVHDAVAHVLDGLQALPPHDDVAPGIRSMVGAGHEVAALTNGAAATASALLGRAGIRDSVTAVLSVEDAPRWKPAPEAYRYALEALGRPADGVVLVAVHPWDIDGAARAGLRTVWLNRGRSAYPSAMTPADHEVGLLTDVAVALGGRGGDVRGGTIKNP